MIQTKELTFDKLWRPQVFTTLAGGDTLYRKLDENRYQRIDDGRTFDLTKMYPGLVLEITSVDYKAVNTQRYAT